MIQLILHLIGDFLLQSHWMAENKTKCSKAAAAHALTYSLPFLLLQPSWAAFSVILGTHFLIDRFRLARFVVYAKNWFLQPDGEATSHDIMTFEMFGDEAGFDVIKRVKDGDQWQRRWTWSNCSTTGYPSDVPPWLAVWLLIAADNTLHIAINFVALRWL